MLWGEKEEARQHLFLIDLARRWGSEMGIAVCMAIGTGMLFRE